MVSDKPLNGGLENRDEGSRYSSEAEDLGEDADSRKAGVRYPSSSSSPSLSTIRLICAVMPAVTYREER